MVSNPSQAWKDCGEVALPLNLTAAEDPSSSSSG